MKTLLQCAIDLGALGFEVFPVRAHVKTPPLFKRFWERASTDPDKIRELWKYDPELGAAESYNPAISTTRFRDGALIVVDVDPKHGGNESMEDLQIIKGCHFPGTYGQHTPSGGAHYVYRIDKACAGSEGKLAPGLDIRSHHNYILGAGAETDAGVYTCLKNREVTYAPDWLVQWALAHPPADERAPESDTPIAVDRRNALRKAHDYLTGLGVASEGKRDASAFRAAAYLREMGLSPADAIEQMALWFKYEGEFTAVEIQHATESAFKYAKGEAGGAAPERYFAPIPEEEALEPASPPREAVSPGGVPDEESSGDLRDVFNKHYAFAMMGNQARVMWEFVNHWGRPTREFLSVEHFKLKTAGELMLSADGKKMEEVAVRWLRWKKRRSYDSIVFAPGRKLPPRFYNIWRGFAYEPLARGERPTDIMKEALEMYKLHTLVNCAAEVKSHAAWLMNFAAHMIQKPEEKPLVAVVFKGSRGSGKSSWAQRNGALVEPHLFVASDQRYLVGNFNGHMSETLMFVLEEAFWGGSKSAEGVLKEVVTGEKLTIEQKFREAFRTENYMRVVIIGNEDWQVPAALKDERRWAVFNVELRSMPSKTDVDKAKARAWFRRMRKLMEAGGYRYLLTYLMGIDLQDADIDGAPRTEALVEQIEQTLSPLYQWWLECLRDGRIVGSDIRGWPGDIEKQAIRDAFTRYCVDRWIESRRPSTIAIGKELRRVCPSMLVDKKNKDNVWVYRLPALPIARDEWEKVIGRAHTWPDAEEY